MAQNKDIESTIVESGPSEASREHSMIDEEKQTSARATEMPEENYFFPFSSNEAQREFERTDFNALRAAKDFPWAGLVGVFGSIVMVALSGVILLAIKDKSTSSWDPHLPRPAALLSAVLSCTSIFLKKAFDEGASIAWWYGASKDAATVNDLHKLWTHTSIGSVVKDCYTDVKNEVVRAYRVCVSKPNVEAPKRENKGRHFTYLGLATIFIAAIPANGILLQNAVRVFPTQMNALGPLTIPSTNAPALLQFGGTGILNNTDKTVSSWSKILGLATEMGIVPGTTEVDLQKYNTGCPDTCNATVKGLGFQYTTQQSTVPYDLTVRRFTDGGLVPGQPIVEKGIKILQTEVWWNNSHPDDISVSALWKGTSSYGCGGNLSYQSWNLSMATVGWPVSIKTNLTFPTVEGPSNLTIMELDPKIDVLDMNLQIYGLTEVASIEGPNANEIYHSTFGGLADLFGTLYNSSVTIQWDETSMTYKYKVRGYYGQQQFASYNYHQNMSSCRGDFQGLNTYNKQQYHPIQNHHSSSYVESVGNQFLASIQQTMFVANGYLALSMSQSYNKANKAGIPSDMPTGALQWTENQYKIVWRWYFASLAITLAIALIVTPTFWGFWRLERRVTMSPVDTARSLQAADFSQADRTVQAEKLLKQLGAKNIHRDLEAGGRASAIPTPGAA